MGLAPGDDVASPFTEQSRVAHAESGGASGFAAGVVLLVASQNPELSLSELGHVLSVTATEVEPTRHADSGALADAADLLPVGRDRDGHNAKHGYGRLSAARACSMVSDPVCAALIVIGEDEAAERYCRLRGSVPWLESLYTPELGRWAARACLRDPSILHAVSALLRTARLLANHPDRQHAQQRGALLRQVALVSRALGASRLAASPSDPLPGELASLEQQAKSALSNETSQRRVERRLLALAEELWPTAHTGQSQVRLKPVGQLGETGSLRA